MGFADLGWGRVWGVGAAAMLVAVSARAEHRAGLKPLFDPPFDFFSHRFSSDNLSPDFIASTFVGMDTKFSKECRNFKARFHNARPSDFDSSSVP